MAFEDSTTPRYRSKLLLPVLGAIIVAALVAFGIALNSSDTDTGLSVATAAPELPPPQTGERPATPSGKAGSVPAPNEQ